MKNLDKLKELIENSIFDLDIVEYTDGGNSICLTTAKCKSGLFLKIRIYETDKIYLKIDLCYGDDSYPILEKFSDYSPKTILNALSSTISSFCTVSNNIGNEISRLETSIMLAPSVEWVEIFKNELINIFKDVDIDRTEYLTVHLIGIDFIVNFDDDTHAFSVKVVQTANPENSKKLLAGVVCDNNYNNVLSAIRKEFKNAKSRFCHLESISNMIIWGK